MSQRHFQRIFKALTNDDMTPSDYRRIGRRALFLKKVEIDEVYIRHIQSKVSLEPTIQVYPKRF